MHWALRHELAWREPQGPETGIVGMVRAWQLYGARHMARNGAGLSADAFLGPEWARIGAALRELLNGDCGRLDCGTVDALIADELMRQGYDPDIEDWG